MCLQTSSASWDQSRGPHVRSRTRDRPLTLLRRACGPSPLCSRNELYRAVNGPPARFIAPVYTGVPAERYPTRTPATPALPTRSAHSSPHPCPMQCSSRTALLNHTLNSLKPVSRPSTSGLLTLHVPVLCRHTAAVRSSPGRLVAWCDIYPQWACCCHSNVPNQPPPTPPRNSLGPDPLRN